MEFKTLEEMIEFHSLNSDEYDLTFQSDRSLLYKKGQTEAVATVIDERSGYIAFDLLKRMIGL